MKTRASIFGVLLFLLWASLAFAASAVSIGSLPLAGIGSSYGPNVMFALSVEFPTAGSAFNTKTSISSVADLDVSGVGNTPFLGYFDYAKCYKYSGSGSTGYFSPYASATLTSVTTGTGSSAKTYQIYTCDGTAWSGNLLNWATMSAIDIFRATLTGGNRALGTGGWSSGNTTASTLTSDYSAGDTTTATYLRRAAVVPGQNQGYNLTGKPVSGLTVSGTNYLAKITPYSTSYTNLWFSNGPGYDSSSTSSHPWSVSIYRASSGSQPSSPYEVDNAIVKVCVSGMVETGSTTPYTCKQYGSNYKPEGLIQTNGSKMRFGAASYLVNTQYTQDGGALRARLKYPGISQTVTGSSGNTYTLGAEWNSDGTFVVNPDANDAASHIISSADTSTTYGSTLAVSNSGVVNYLNKFGDTITGNVGYKGYDPAAHLYYAALRYYRNYGNYSTFTNTLSSNTAWQGGFPAITDWDDPILNSCQKNFIIYIGDSNTHNDIDLPGSTWSGAVPPTDDTAFNVSTWTSNIGVDEGMTGTQYQTVNTGSTNSPPYIAGLAWWANANNIRDAGDTKTASVSSFMIDVVESGNYKGANNSPCGSWPGKVCNAFFMAAKYGGFTDSNANGWPDRASEWASPATSSTSTTGPASISVFPSPAAGYTGTPTNYAPANNPAAMISALTNALSTVSGSANASQSGLTPSGGRVYTPGSYVFQAAFNSTDWSGDLIANTVSVVTNSAGTQTPVYTPAWQAKLTLETQLNSSVTSRNVITYDYTTMAGATFNTSWFTGLKTKNDVPTGTASFQYSALNASSYGSYRVNYLRGDKTQESSTASPQFRARNYRMGDVVHSTPVYIPTPKVDPAGCTFDANLSNPATDRSSIFSRPAAVAVSANDGFTHIFNASSTSSTLGQELAAYLPASIYPNLPNLASTTYSHQFFNDGSPVYKDVCFLYGSTGSVLSSPEARSVLVGTTGAGGTSVYALDVTHVDSMSSSNVLWEFSAKDDPKLGYTIGNPVITKLNNGRPVVIFGNGFNQSSGTTASLFVLYLDKQSGTSWTKGTNYFRIDLPAPTLLNTSPNGLSAPGITISNGAVQVAYAGDLNGNLWKFNLSATDPTTWVAPTAPLFTACSSYTVSSPTSALSQCTASTVQPITTGTYVTKDPLRGYLILFGTGQYLSGNDLNQTNTQTLYGIRDDGLLSAKNTLTANLLAQKVGPVVTTTTSNGITKSFYSIVNDAANTTSSCSGAASYLPYGCNGWFLPLAATGFTSGREVATPYIYENTLAFFSVAMPSSNSVCGSGGSTADFGLNYATGSGTVSAIFDTSGNGSMNSADQVANAMVNNGISLGGSMMIRIGNITYRCSSSSSGAITCTAMSDYTSSYGRLSWREIIQSW